MVHSSADKTPTRQRSCVLRRRARLFGKKWFSLTQHRLVPLRRLGFIALVCLCLTVFRIDAPFAQQRPIEPVTIQLRWSHQFQFAGYYAAVEKGFYAAEGLDVDLREALPGQDRVAPVLDGRAQYGVGDTVILKLRSDGRPLVVLAQIFQHSPNVLITKRDSGIFSPYELVGKTIVLSGDPISSAAVRAMILETLGDLDRITILPRSNNETDYFGGRADAVSGYLSNEPYRLKQAGVAVNIIDPRSYGIDFYGDNLFTTEQEVREHPGRVARVLRATLKGWAYALENKDEIIDLILTKYNPTLDREQLRFEAKVTDQMILADIIPIGDANPRRYARIAELLHHLGMSPSPEIPQGFLYGQGSGPAVQLTVQERAWLQDHPDIRFVFSNDFQPVLIVHENNRLSGILKDMLDLLNERLRTDFAISVVDLESVRTLAREKEVGGVLAISPEGAKRLGLLATDTHIRSYPTVFSRVDSAIEVRALGDLQGYRCAFVDGMPTIEALMAPYEDRMTFNRVETVFEGLKLLFEGNVDFFFGLSQHAYMIHANQFTGLRPVLTVTDRPIDAVMGIRGDWPQLVAILNKGLAAISPAERNAIYARWNAMPSADSPSVALTAEERAWLEKHPAVLVGIADMPPFIIPKPGQRPTGIFIDLIERAVQGTGLELRYDDFEHLGDETPHIVPAGRRPDVVPCVKNQTAVYDSLIVSKELMRTPLVIFADQASLPVHGMQDLFGRTVAFREGNDLHRVVSQDYPQIKRLSFETEQQAMEAVHLGRADAYIGNLTVGSHLILQNHWVNLKIAGASGLDDQVLFFGVRKELPELRSILDKGLDAISSDERAAIRNKYLSIRYEHGIDGRDLALWGLMIGLAFSLAVGTFLVWNLALSRKVATRTADLDATNQRLLGEIEERMNTEKALRESRDYLNNLTNCMADVILAVRQPERTIEWINDAVRTFGYEPAACIGRTTAFFYANKEDFSAFGKVMQSAVAAGSRSVTAETLFKRKDGTTFPVEVTASFFVTEGRLVKVTGIIKDVSERKDRERQVEAYQQSLKELASQLTMSEEKERRRIAVNLHDQVGQALTFARMRLAVVKEAVGDDKAAAYLEEASQHLLKATRDTRHLVSDLSSPAMRDIGLGAAIAEWLDEQLPRHGLKSTFVDQTDVECDRALSEDVRLLLFRNVRELLINVVKHAAASHVTVRLQNDGQELRIGVEDNGCGCGDAEAIKGKGGKHFGVFSIKERMAHIGGALDITSAPGHGCRAVLRLPMKKTTTESRRAEHPAPTPND